MRVKVYTAMKSSKLPVSGDKYPESGKISALVAQDDLLNLPVRQVVEVEDKASCVETGFEDAPQESSNFLG